MHESPTPSGQRQAAEVACVGEALVLLPASPVDGVEATSGTLAGAEANVAAALASMGVPVSWVGRLGPDAMGSLLYDELERRGVGVSAVQIDPDRPTGVYAKQPHLEETEDGGMQMVYRRAGSAASAMHPTLLHDPDVDAVLRRSTVIHTSGITPALSSSCADMMFELLGQPRQWSARICFDVNWREQLWPSGDPDVVARLAKMADIVLVGGDEAIRVFGTDEPDTLRKILPAPEQIILKDGSHRALAIARDGTVVQEPALSVEVVEVIGAGDAFAAGFITGLVRGESTHRCLRRGHLSAASVLTTTADSSGVMVGATDLLDAAPEVWAAAHLSASGVTIQNETGVRR